ncbi:MAG: hypothetical protein QW279_14540 [Candidatus Jordarchaeaceae archaeon]
MKEITLKEIEVVLRTVMIVARDLYRVEKKINKICEKLGLSTEVEYAPGEYLDKYNEIVGMFKSILGENHELINYFKIE